MNKKNRKRGFTLIETILLIVVLGVIAFISAPIIDSAIESWSFVTYRSELWQNGELAFSRMSSEIREIGGTSDILAANSQTFQFVTVGGEDITYSLSGTTLNRNGTALITGVNAFAFTYFDSSLNQLVNPLVSPAATNIRVVRLYLVLGPTGRTFALQTDVQPRNLD